MAGKPGHEPKSVGQRSISSMFSNSRIMAGRSGNGRPLPLMEFLNRKSEKRTSIQGCVADAGLTLEVRERLDATRKNDTRRRNMQTPPRLEIFSNQSGSTSAVDGGCHPADCQGSRDLDGQENASPHSQSRSRDFIDLTEDAEPAVGSGEGEDYAHENTEHRKRRRSQAQGATEMCPVCNERFPPHMLQAHVESELDALEMLETNYSEPDAHIIPAGGNIPHEDGSAGGWEDHHARFPECSAQLKEPGINSRPRQSLLVLGDEPKRRRQPHFRSHKNKRPNNSATFNHYADGAGWWDEGGVGVDAEAVGSASVWEGLGSISFGGML